MPLTPFHYPVAYLISKLDQRLSLPGLIVGSMVSDLEIPVLIWVLAPARLVLHSLLGAATFGTLLSLVITKLIYPSVVGAFFGLDTNLVKSKCTLSRSLIISCLLGSASHVVLDAFTHLQNPIFWPVQASTPSPIFTNLCSLLYESRIYYRCFQPLSQVIQVILAVVLALLVIRHRKNLWEKILVG